MKQNIENEISNEFIHPKIVVVNNIVLSVLSIIIVLDEDLKKYKLIAF